MSSQGKEYREAILDTQKITQKTKVKTKAK